MHRFAVSTAMVAQMGEVPGPEIYWMGHFGEWFPLQINVVLIQGEGQTILINSGPPEDYLSHMNTVWQKELGDKTHISIPPGHAMKEVLAEWGVTPADVDIVVVTPLQAYAIGGIDLFPRAEVRVSRTGWLDLLAPKHFDERRHMAVPDRLLGYLLFDLWPQRRVRLLKDEDEVVPGVRTWWAGTHHRSSLAIEVKTADGLVAISDVAFYYDNLEHNIPLGIGESLEECRNAYARLKRAKRFVSLYDPSTLLRYPGGRVSGEGVSS